MPYIDKTRRREISEDTLNFTPAILTPGELNYLLTEALISYIKVNGLSYQSINDVVGALECAKLEFVRRVVNKYEDSKIKENGDVYPVIL